MIGAYAIVGVAALLTFLALMGGAFVVLLVFALLSLVGLLPLGVLLAGD